MLPISPRKVHFCMHDWHAPLCHADDNNISHDSCCLQLFLFYCHSFSIFMFIRWVLLQPMAKCQQHPNMPSHDSCCLQLFLFYCHSFSIFMFIRWVLLQPMAKFQQHPNMPFPLAVKLELSRQSQHLLSWLPQQECCIIGPPTFSYMDRASSSRLPCSFFCT